MKVSPEFAIAAVGLGVASFVLYRSIPHVTAAVDGALSGDNTLTRTATNSKGEQTTAYAGAGVLGTLGAAANKISGGTLATFGEWLGGKAADAFISDPTASQTRYQTPSTSSSGWNDYDEVERLLARYPAPNQAPITTYNSAEAIGLW